MDRKFGGAKYGGAKYGKSAKKTRPSLKDYGAAPKKAAPKKKVNPNNMANKAGAGGSKAPDHAPKYDSASNKAGAGGSKAARGKTPWGKYGKAQGPSKTAAKKKSYAPSKKRVAAAKKKKAGDKDWYNKAVRRGFGRNA